MSRWLAGLLAGIVLMWPAPVEAQKKNKKVKDQAVEATPTEYALLRAQAGAVGKLGAVNASSRTFTLKIEQTGSLDPSLPVSLNTQIRLENFWQQQQRVLLSTNPAQLARRLEHLQSMQRQLVLHELRRQAQMLDKSGAAGKGVAKKAKLAPPAKQFELEATDKAVVRLGFLPVRYDDKGNAIEYTPRELEKLRGDKTKPGLAATFDDMQTGQVVRVFLAKSQPKAAKPAKGKDNNDEADRETPPRPQVAMILILADSNDPLPPEPRKRKKKN